MTSETHYITKQVREAIIDAIDKHGQGFNSRFAEIIKVHPVTVGLWIKEKRKNITDDVWQRLLPYIQDRINKDTSMEYEDSELHNKIMNEELAAGLADFRAKLNEGRFEEIDTDELDIQTKIIIEQLVAMKRASIAHVSKTRTVEVPPNIGMKDAVAVLDYLDVHQDELDALKAKIKESTASSESSGLAKDQDTKIA